MGDKKKHAHTINPFRKTYGAIWPHIISSSSSMSPRGPRKPQVHDAIWTHMVPYGPIRPQIGQDGSIWHQMGPDGPRWPHMEHRHHHHHHHHHHRYLRWAEMVPDDPIWLHLVPYGLRWDQTAPDGSIWFHMALYGPIWSQLCFHMTPDGSR